MKFSGRLQIEADPREWLKTDLSLAQGRLELTSGSEVLGSWSMSQVKAERVEGDRFQLLLGDDRALFAADDALAFSYEALPHLSKKHVIAGPTGLRGRLRNSLRNSERQATEPQPERHAPAVPIPQGNARNGGESPISHPVARRLRDLIEAAGQEQAAQQESSVESLVNGARGFEDDRPEAAPALIQAVAEETADVSEPAQAEPFSEADVETAELEPEPEVWRPTSEPPAEPVDFGLTSPTRTNAIRLDLVPAFARSGPTNDEEPEDRVMVALESVLAEVRQGSMSPAQVAAVTDLVQAVTDLIAARRSSSYS